jgi:CHASE2 domain-containing sensor protein
MATIDSRITPLVETLIASGADSIALEILSEIRRGRVDEDTEEELREAREAIGHFREGKRPPEFVPREPEVRHLSGEEQIEFAAEYAIERLTRDLEMAEASLENLNKITTGADVDSASAGATKSANTVLRWVDTEGVLDRKQIEEAKAKLPALREALSVWSTAAREGAKSE